MSSKTFDRALVACSSKVMQGLISRFLQRYARRIDGAMSLDHARQQIPELEASDLVVADTDIEKTHSSLSLLAEIAAGDTANRPAVIVVSGVSDLECETRASQLGAIGFLLKPVSLRNFSAVLRHSSSPFETAAPRLRAKAIGEAVLLDAPMGTHVAKWEVEDISTSGAFLRTHVSYAPDEILPLQLHLGSARIFVSGRVIRSRPSEFPSQVGVGVRFELDSSTRREVQEALALLASQQVVESQSERGSIIFSNSRK